MLQFVRGVPNVGDSYIKHRDASQRQELNDIRISEGRRAERVARETDEAIGRALQPQPDTLPPAAVPVPVPAGMDSHAAASLQNDPGAAQFQTAQAQPSGQPQAPQRRDLRAVRADVARNLANVKGARAEALKMMMADAAHEEAIMRQTFEMAKTDPAQAKLYAQQFGVKLAPAMEAALNDRTTVTNWAKAMDAARAAFPDSHQAGKRMAYAQSYFQGLNSGNLPEAIKSAPQPQDTPRYQQTLTDITDPKTGQTYRAWADPNTQTITPTGWQGSPRAPQFLQGNDGSLHTYQGGQAVPVTDAQGQPFKGGTGLRAVGANRTHSLAPNPQSIRMRALSWAERQKDETGLPIYSTPQQIENAIKGYEAYISGDYQTAAQILGQGGAASVAQEQQTATAPSSAAPQVHTGGMLRTDIPSTYSEGGITGTFTGEFEGGLPVYVTSDGRRFVAE